MPPASQTTHRTVLDDRRMSQQWSGRKFSWHNRRAVLASAWRDLSHDILCPSRDSNRTPSQYKSRALPLLQPTRISLLLLLLLRYYCYYYCNVYDETEKQTHVQEENMERFKMQQRRTETRTTAEAAGNIRNKGPRWKTANEYSDGTDVRWGRHEALEISKREANSRMIDGGTEYGEMDIMEGSTTA
jgi:hypothetical protein